MTSDAKKYDRQDADLARVQVAKQLDVPIKSMMVVGSVALIGRGKDVDVMVLIDSGTNPLFNRLRAAGFKQESHEGYEDQADFQSFRRGHINLLLVTDPDYFLTEAAAVVAARVLNLGAANLSEREGRIAYHGLMREEMRKFRGYVQLRELGLD